MLSRCEPTSQSISGTDLNLFSLLCMGTICVWVKGIWEGLIIRFVLMLNDFYEEIGEAGTIPGLHNVKKLGAVQ